MESVSAFVSFFQYAIKIFWTVAAFAVVGGGFVFVIYEIIETYLDSKRDGYLNWKERQRNKD